MQERVAGPRTWFPGVMGRMPREQGVTWVRTGAVALGSLPVFSIHPTVAHMKMSLKDAPEVAANTSPSKACCTLEPAASVWCESLYNKMRHCVSLVGRVVLHV